MKVRIRWYADYSASCEIVQNPVLEIKTKNGLLGGKALYPLDSFPMDGISDKKVLYKTFRDSDIPAQVKECMMGLNPRLVNSYSRKYFLSIDREFRITIDSDLYYGDPFEAGNSFHDLTTTVLELKYREEADFFVDSITSYFPFRIAKCSKYVTGIGILGYE